VRKNDRPQQPKNVAQKHADTLYHQVARISCEHHNILENFGKHRCVRNGTTTKKLVEVGWVQMPEKDVTQAPKCLQTKCQVAEFDEHCYLCSHNNSRVA